MERSEVIRWLGIIRENLMYLPKIRNKQKIEALDYAVSSLKTDEAYQLIYEGVDVYTKEEVAAILRDLLSEISEIIPNVAASDYWDGYESCKNDTIKRMILSRIDKLLKEDR